MIEDLARALLPHQDPARLGAAGREHGEAARDRELHRRRARRRPSRRGSARFHPASPGAMKKRAVRRGIGHAERRALREFDRLRQRMHVRRLRRRRAPHTCR